jgi:hypothetical protein
VATRPIGGQRLGCHPDNAADRTSSRSCCQATGNEFGNEPLLRGCLDPIGLAVHADERVRRRERGALPTLRAERFEHFVSLGIQGSQSCEVDRHAGRVREPTHTYATALVNAGCSLQALMALLGHASADMSLRYGRLFDATVRADYERALVLAKKRLGPLRVTPTTPPKGN